MYIRLAWLGEECRAAVAVESSRGGSFRPLVALAKIQERENSVQDDTYHVIFSLTRTGFTFASSH